MDIAKVEREGIVCLKIDGRLDGKTAFDAEARVKEVLLSRWAGKLNLADLSEEGANLVALQTRQQLGINALSFAGQSEQSILSLFR